MENWTCNEHDDCTVIALLANEDEPSVEYDGRNCRWHSHAHSELHVECRTNSDPCQGCLSNPNWPR